MQLQLFLPSPRESPQPTIPGGLRAAEKITWFLGNVKRWNFMSMFLMGNVVGTLGSIYILINLVVLHSLLGRRAKERNFNEIPQVFCQVSDNIQRQNSMN